MKSKIWCVAAVFAYASAVGVPNVARASDLNVSDTPLFAAVSIDPNIVFSLDDSGSMHWEGMPEAWAYIMPQALQPYGGTLTYGLNIPRFRDNYFWNLRLRNPQLNGVFYNPELDYQPWARADGTSYPDADPDAALRNPFLPSRGTLDLDSLNTWFNWAGGGPNDTGNNNQFWPITFYIYDGTGNTDIPANYTKYQIRENQAFTATPANAPMTPIPQFVWPDGTIRTIEEEKQNFANWFSYSRSRVLAARNGIGRAFVELPENARVGFAAINQGFSTVDGQGTRALVSGVRPFTGVDRDNFYDLLYGRVIAGGTPMRRAAEDVGQYFERTDSQGPWSSTPGSAGGDDLACRQSYHILMTDGFWNGANPAVGNSDNLAGPIHTDPEGATDGYTPTDPYRDTRSDTLADVGMDFWKRDLRTDLENRVPTNAVDTAFWQHLTTFGIGLGVTGNLDPVDVDDAVTNGTAIAWGNPFAPGDNPAKIDDLLHFGINGRGGFFSATDPDTFAQQLGEILRDIVARAGATTGLSASSTRLNAGAVVYTAGFDSEDWTGELEAIDANSGVQIESAATRLDLLGYNNRNIFTWDPVADDGAVFEPTGDVLTRVMDLAPGGWSASELFDYLRGDLTAGSGTFRVRASMLGDIVGSQPVFSGPGNEGWADIDPLYLDYIDEGKRDPRDPCESPPCTGDRRNTVFVGANDGMLHAFDAVTLEEHFAYVPSAVHEHLYQLADPGYTHRYFVDGQMAVADANIGGWGTYLVGALGAGGRGIYALDVTEPQNFDENMVKWEFTAEDDLDVGLTFGKPAIGRTVDGTWIAVFGNGYNSQNNQAYLYVLNLDTGVPISKIAVGPAGSNGLSGVALVPAPGDPLNVKYAYAGDLQGNMWKFDIANNGSASPAFGASDPLFTDPDGRPIIAEPNVALHPTDGFMVYFGTGKLIEDADRLNTTTLERFYALRDLDVKIPSIASLDEVTVSAVPGGRTFTPTGSGTNGWYAEMAVGTPSGERVLFSPLVFAGRVVFSSYEPANDPCTPGGIQRAYVLRALSGSGELPDASNPNLGGIEVGAGAAFAPVIGIKNAVAATGTPGNDAGFQTPDPDCVPPGCPATPVDPTVDPGAALAGRDNWCREIGLQQPGSWIPIGRLCEGRQAWRQIR